MNPVKVAEGEILRIEPSDKVRLIKVTGFEKIDGQIIATLEMKEAEKWGDDE